MGAVGERRLTAPAIRARRGRLLATAAGLLALVFALWLWLRFAGPLPGDRAAASWWRHWDPDTSAPVVARSAIAFFDDLATPAVAVLTVAILAGLAYALLGARWALLVAAASGVVVLNAALKQLFGPTALWVTLRHGGHNFPSGHVAYATSLFGLVGVLALAHRARVIAAACLAVIVLMGCDRVIGQTHLPSDVIAGYAVGGAWLCALLALGVPWAARR